MFKSQRKNVLLLNVFTFIILSMYSSCLLGKEIIFQNGLNGYNGIQDTWINGSGSASKNYNYGASEVLELWGIPHTGYKKNPLIRFDNTVGEGLNQVPPHAKINSVKLELYQFKTDPEAVYPANVARMLVPWNAGTSDGVPEGGAVCYNYRVYSETDPKRWGGDGTLGPERGVDYAQWNWGDEYWVTTHLPTEPGWVSSNISDIYKAWFNGEANYGVLLVMGTSWKGSSFHSSEYMEDPSLRPRLVVDYTAVDKEATEISVSHTKIPAGGEENPVTIKVKVLDDDGNPIPNTKVELKKTLGPEVKIVDKNEGMTDNRGEAEFIVTSIKTGLIKLYPIVHHGELEGGVALENKVCSIDFVQSVDTLASGIVLGTDVVSADGKSKNVIKVKLQDYDKKPVVGRKVILSTDAPEKINIAQNEIVTNEQGEANFYLTSAISSLDPIFGRVTALVAPDIEGEESIPFLSLIEFTGRLLTEEDGGAFSHLYVGRNLAIGLKDEDIELDTIPNDGISLWEIKTFLIDKQGPVANRRVVISVQGGEELSAEELYPRDQLSNENGEVLFYLKTQRELSEVDLKIEVIGDYGGNWSEKFKFTSSGSLVYVVDAYPFPGSDDVDVTSDFEFIFNSNIQLIDNKSYIRLIPRFGNGNASEIYDRYEGLADSSWQVIGNKVIWKHERLKLNTLYEARLEGVAAESDSSLVMKPFEWRFEGTDITPPSIISVEPSPWSVGVSTEPVVNLMFSEELIVDQQTGIPQGLFLEIKDSNNIILPKEKINFLSYDLQNHTVNIQLNLESGTTYTVAVFGALDYAELEMIPYFWSFTTVNENPPGLAKIVYDTNIHGDVKVESPITVYFNKAIKQSPKPEIIITKSSNGEPVPGSTEFVTGFEGIGLVFSPDEGIMYDFDTFYKVTMKNVFDEDGQEYFDEEIVFLTEVKASEPLPVEDDKTHIFHIEQDEGEDLIIEVAIPKGTGVYDSEMKVYMVHSNRYEEFDIGKYNSNLALTPSIFEIICLQEGKPVSKLDKSLTITIPYTDVANKADGTGEVIDIMQNRIPETTLKAYFWDNSRKEWLPIGGTVDYIDNRVIFKSNRLGTYALIGSFADTETFLSDFRVSTNPLSIGEIPARKQTTFKFRLSSDSKVTIAIFDNNGRMLGNILNEEPYTSGYNGFIWDGTINGLTLKPGIYVYRLSAQSLLSTENGNAWVSGVIGITR